MNGSAIWGAFAAAAIVGIEVSPADPLPVARAVRAEPVEIHYAPEEDLEAIDVALIGSAQNTIDMDAYVLTAKLAPRPTKGGTFARFMLCSPHSRPKSWGLSTSEL